MQCALQWPHSYCPRASRAHICKKKNTKYHSQIWGTYMQKKKYKISFTNLRHTYCPKQTPTICDRQLMAVTDKDCLWQTHTTQFQIKGWRWVNRRNILDGLGIRGKSFLKGFTNRYFIFKDKSYNKKKLIVLRSYTILLQNFIWKLLL